MLYSLEVQWRALFPTLYSHGCKWNFLITHLLQRFLFVAVFYLFIYFIYSAIKIIMYIHCSLCLKYSSAFEISHVSVFWCYCVSSPLISGCVCLCSFCHKPTYTLHTHIPSSPWAPHETPQRCFAASWCLLLRSQSSRLTVSKALQGYSQLLLLLLLMTH